ncbi:MAG: hypothetical protein ABSG87_10405 [Verrucomicrobiota bacterium]|jgi:hypothetical protein
MNETKHCAFCDCGGTATVLVGSAWVCVNCFEIDWIGIRREKEQKEKEQKEGRVMDADKLASPVGFYAFHSNH